MPASKVWKPKPGAPDYVPIRTSDVWSTVKSKWTSLGSPEAQCPVGRFGAAGSLENEECKRRVEPIWNKFEDVFPDLPETGPYNNLVDLVLIEDVCALGHFDDPEADIGPAPNLFENPGGLAQKLQEWYLRSLVPLYCEIAPITALDGACLCWPYFWSCTYRTKVVGAIDWSEPSTGGGVFFGPLRGFGVDIVDSPDFGGNGYSIYANGASNPGGFRFGTINDCGIAAQKYVGLTGSGFDDAEILSINSVTPFTPEDVSFYGLGYASEGPNSAGFCPLPNKAPPLPNYPNTRGSYMPLPVPIISFPNGPGCSPSEDNLNITFNLNVDAPDAGPPGIDGQQGKDGPTVIRTILQRRSEFQLDSFEPGQVDMGGVTRLPEDCAFVRVTFNTSGVTQENYNSRRVYFAPADDPDRRKEIGYGNAYLRLGDGYYATLERIVLSMEQTLIAIPPSVEGQRWRLVVNDKGSVGYVVTDLGLRHVLRRVRDVEGIPEWSYEGQ